MAVLDLRDALERAYRLGWNEGDTRDESRLTDIERIEHRDSLASYMIDRILKEMRVNHT